MARSTVPSTAVRRLLEHLFGSTPSDGFADEVEAWLTGSPRFRSFADEHRDKIRKKLRTATDPEARRDVRVELLLAHRLLADRRIELAFETYGTRTGGPDFTITFRAGRSFNLEVTRLRGAPAAAVQGSPWLAKLRQLPPSVPNAVVVAVDGDQARALDVAAAARELRTRADANDEAFFASRGFAGRRGFYERFLRLGAVVVWCEGAAAEQRATLWLNRSARIPLPDRAVLACLNCLRAG